MKLYLMFFEERSHDSVRSIEDRDLVSTMLKLKKEQKIEVNYLVDDKVTKKVKRVVRSNMSSENLRKEFDEVSANAHRQKDFLLILLRLSPEETIDMSTLTKEHNISTSVVNRGVDKKWCIIEEVEIYRDPYQDSDIKQTKPLILNDEQQAAYDEINTAVQKDKHEVFLLQGITGSGKTEVYLQTIAEVLEKGEGALVLVPEIALTPQMVHRFKGRFGELVAVLHSGLSNGEKYDEWRKIEKGEARVVVGARSSVFAPIKNLGIIVIDEEHETSYKQSESPRYHARDVAVWRGERHDCPLVLGSATPALESRARASKGVYTLLELKNRVNSRPLPKVNIIDMREEMRAGNSPLFSNHLTESLKDRLKKKKNNRS